MIAVGVIAVVTALVMGALRLSSDVSEWLLRSLLEAAYWEADPPIPLTGAHSLAKLEHDLPTFRHIADPRGEVRQESPTLVRRDDRQVNAVRRLAPSPSQNTSVRARTAA
jgi:hypothetical protein